MAMLVSRDPAVLTWMPVRNGFDSHEDMHTLRPRPDLEVNGSDR